MYLYIFWTKFISMQLCQLLMISFKLLVRIYLTYKLNIKLKINPIFIVKKNIMTDQKGIKEPLISKEEPEPEEIQPVSFFSLFKYSDSLDKALIFVGSLAAMAGGASMPFFMIFFSQITEIFIPGRQDQAIEKGWEVAVKFFILGGATWFLNFLGIYSWSMTGKRQSIRFKKTYYKILLQQEVAWYDSNDVNKLSTQISGNMVAVETAIGQKVSFLLTTTVTSLFGFIYAYFKCWQLSLILTGFLPLLLIAGVSLMKAMQLKAQISKVSYEGASGVAQQALSSIRTIKSLVAQSFQESKFIQALSESQKKVVKYILFSSASLAIMTIIFLGLYSFGFWYGKQLIIWFPETYNAPLVMSTFFCFLIGGASVGQISPLLKNIAEGKVAAGKLYYLINRKKTLIEPEPGIQVNDIERISFKDVSFKYEKVKIPKQKGVQQKKDGKIKPKDDLNQSSEEIKQQKDVKTDKSSTVLDNININFKRGQVTALVGESGSGKSSVIQLLMRFYDPKSGEILINDKNLRQINIQSFRKKIGFVGQEPVLFSMSIAENLKISDPNLSQSQIKQILQKANAWEFVEKCEKGIETYVGTNGTQLSGGQKQRIAIARALAKNPSILVLDEATSALDRKNEKQIQKTLHNLCQGNITTIVVAHRLSTIRNADKIIVLGKGKILEQGNHEELYAKEGAYFQLVKSQIMASNQQKMGEQQIKPDQAEKQMEHSEKKIENEKTAEKEKEGESKYSKEKLDAVFGKLFKQSKGSYCYLFFGCISAFLNGLIWPCFNIAFSNIMTMMAIAKEKSEEINFYCLMFLVVAAAGSFTTFSYTFCFGIAGERLVYTLRNKLFSKLLVMPISFYDKPDNTAGGISAKISQDSYQINNMITGVMGVICLNISTVSISLIFAFYYSWKLTLIVLALSPLLVVSGAINMAVMKGMSQKSQKFQKAVGSMISDTVCNVRTVKSFGSSSAFLNLFDSKLDEIGKLSSQKALKSSILQGLSRGSVMFVEGLTFWIAAILFANLEIVEPKAIFIAIFSIIFAATGVGQNSQFMPDMGKAKISGASIYEIIESKDEVEQAKQTEENECNNKFQGDIQFLNVRFKYPERDTLVFNNFNMKIKKGQKAALVGASGSGKSTIIQLLMRFYPIQQGQILVDGIDINKYNLHKYRKQIGLVSQQPTLFLGSVKDNIVFNQKFSKQNESKAIQKYCKIAHVLDFVNEWPEKFGQDVGQKGTQVSGGQKQRIALARCLIRKPEIILLDQSTSALDADTEKIVFENLKPILKKKTSISIAHRLSTIEDADRIIVMRDGQIIEEGNYNELIERKENFYRLAKGIN